VFFKLIISHVLVEGIRVKYGCETWPMKVELEVGSDRTELTTIRWVCGFALKYRKKMQSSENCDFFLEPVVMKKGRLR